MLSNGHRASIGRGSGPAHSPPGGAGGVPALGRAALLRRHRSGSPCVVVPRGDFFRATDLEVAAHLDVALHLEVAADA